MTCGKLNLLVCNALETLQWVLQRNEPEHIMNVPIDFQSLHWMIHHPSGKLFGVKSVEGSSRRFRFVVTEAGMNFLREYGWKGETKNPASR